jgi:hypothetical protein
VVVGLPEREKGVKDMGQNTRLWFPLAIVACALVACPPPGPVTPPGPDDADAGVDDARQCTTPADCACENLRRLTCAEGLVVNCVDSIEHMLTSRIAHVDPECIASAPSREAVRACAGIGPEGCL